MAIAEPKQAREKYWGNTGSGSPIFITAEPVMP